MNVKAAREMDANAEFFPAGESDYPAIKVAGVLVLVYVDPASGGLIISANFVESELSDPTPVRVLMSGETVWAAIESTSPTDTANTITDVRPFMAVCSCGEVTRTSLSATQAKRQGVEHANYMNEKESK